MSIKHPTRIPLFAIAATALAVRPAAAFEATELPADNLVENPWFRSPVDAAKPGFGLGVWLRETWDGATLVDSATGDQRPPDSLTFGLSQKASNPSPDPRAAQGQGCFNDPTVYCGTAARWAEDRAEGCSLERSGVDAYARQIVAAGDPAHRFLRFGAWWVAHRIAVAEVVVAGSSSAAGPWTPLWTPLHVESPDVDLAAQVPGTSTSDRSVEWMYLTCGSTDCAQAPIVETELGHGYAFYRIEIHARYPELQQVTCQVGVKLTGIYFTTAATGGGGTGGGGGSGSGSGSGGGHGTRSAFDPTGAETASAGCSAGSAASPLPLALAVLAVAGLRRRRRAAAIPRA